MLQWKSPSDTVVNALQAARVIDSSTVTISPEQARGKSYYSLTCPTMSITCPTMSMTCPTMSLTSRTMSMTSPTTSITRHSLTLLCMTGQFNEKEF